MGTARRSTVGWTVALVVSMARRGNERIRTRRVIDEDEGKTRGRNDKLRGHIGVKTSALSEGCTMGPPAESEYAVDPVGVETIMPSDCTTC